MNRQIKNRIKTFFRIGFLKTMIINFRLLPIRQAVKLPIVATRAVVLESLKGKLVITKPAKFGMVKIGTFNTDFFSWNGDKCMLNINGKVFIYGLVQLGVGCKICVDETAVLEIGGNACIGPNVKIICREHIVFGDNIRIAWDGQIFDTNFHYVKDIENGTVKRLTSPVVIGKNNWFGNRCTIMPGTQTNDYFIAASNSLCNKDYRETIPSHSLVAGSPAKLIKRNVVRVLEKEEKIISEQFSKTSENEVVTCTEIMA